MSDIWPRSYVLCDVCKAELIQDSRCPGWCCTKCGRTNIVAAIQDIIKHDDDNSKYTIASSLCV